MFIHLGDVIEHLTDPDARIPRILGLLKKGGDAPGAGGRSGRIPTFSDGGAMGRLLRGQRVFRAPSGHLFGRRRGQPEFFTEISPDGVGFPSTRYSSPRQKVCLFVMF